MIIHSSIRSHEFVDWLRDTAVKHNAAPLFIDQIDRMYEHMEQSEEIARLTQEIEERDQTIASLRECLDKLTKAIGASLEEAKKAKETLEETINKSLEEAKETMEEIAAL